MQGMYFICLFIRIQSVIKRENSSLGIVHVYAEFYMADIVMSCRCSVQCRNIMVNAGCNMILLCIDVVYVAFGSSSSEWYSKCAGCVGATILDVI